ncbi:MAG: hypothetical protein AAGL49_11235, partial [Pseudomonadota bacterium]
MADPTRSSEAHAHDSGASDAALSAVEEALKFDLDPFDESWQGFVKIDRMTEGRVEPPVVVHARPGARLGTTV